MLTIDQLRCFIAVAELRSFRQAAERLSMTQSPVSRQIQSLEREVGVQLLVRDRQSVVLTNAGQVFLREAQSAVEVLDALPVNARRIASGLAGTVRVGSTASAMLIVNELMPAIERSLPEVRIVVEEMISSEQTEALKKAEIELGLVRPPVTAPQLRSTMLYEEPLMLAVPADDPLADDEAGPVRTADIDMSRLISYSPKHPYFADLVTEGLGLSFRSGQRMSQVSSVVAAVNAGRGIALVPRSASRLGVTRVAFRGLADVDPKIVKLAVAWREPLVNPAAQRVCRLLTERFTDLAGRQE